MNMKMDMGMKTNQEIGADMDSQQFRVRYRISVKRVSVKRLQSYIIELRIVQSDIGSSENQEFTPISFITGNEYPTVRDTHGGGWSRNINARYLHTLMVYL